MTEQTKDESTIETRTAHMRELAIKSRLIERVHRLTQNVNDVAQEAEGLGLNIIQNERLSDYWTDAMTELKAAVDAAMPKNPKG